MFDVSSALSLSNLLGTGSATKSGSKLVAANEVIDKSTPTSDIDVSKFLEMVKKEFGDDVAKQITNADGSINFQKFAEIMNAKKLSEDKDKDDDSTIVKTSDDKIAEAKLKDLEESELSLTKMMQLLYPDSGKQEKDKNADPFLSLLA